MSTVRLPSRYRSLVEQEKDRLVRDIMARPDWHTTEDDDPEREVVIRVSVERKQVRQPIKARGRRRFPEGADEPYLAYIRTRECTVAGRFAMPDVTKVAALSKTHVCSGVVEAHHTRSKGAAGDDRLAIPLCTLAHQQWHTWGRWTFTRRYALDVARLIARYIVEYERSAVA